MEKNYRTIFGFWALAFLLLTAQVKGQTPGGASGMVFRFTKQVWLNPTIILAKQNFEQSTNVKLLILPRLNGNDTTGSSKIEKAFDKLLSFLVYKENVQGSIKFYFNPKNPTKPFTFNTSDELFCKFTPIQKDSVETILNQDIINSSNLNNFTALPFDSIINRASRYCKKILQSKPGQCGENPGNEFTLTKINSAPAKLNFEKTTAPTGNVPNGGVDKQKYAELAQYYNTVLDVADNSNYPMAWKAMAANKNDNIKLKLKKKQGYFDINKLVFKNAAGNETYNVTYSNVGNDSTIDLSMSGKSPGSMAEVVAYYTPTTTPTQTFAIGAFNVQFYEPKTMNVVLVNIGGATLPDANTVKANINAIYGNVFINWNVTTATCPLPVNISKSIHVENSGLLSNYMPDMQSIVSYFKDHCSAYNGSSDNTFYLLFGASNDGNLAGYMPRARNTGFIFDNDTRTIAHELGHGAFNLKHIFNDDELGAGNRNSTDNLMDYAAESKLYKHQWDLVHNPSSVGWFEGDDNEGANYQYTGLDFNLFKNPDNATVSFLSRAGTIISIPYNTAKAVEFTYGAIASVGDSHVYSDYIPTGLLDIFILKENINSEKMYKYKWIDADKAYKQVAWANTGDVNYTDMTNGVLYNDPANYQQVDGFVYMTICNGKFNFKKFEKLNLQQYLKGSKSIADFQEFSIPLFGAYEPMSGKVQVEDLKYYNNCRWCANEKTTEMTKDYCETEFYIYADKIAQLRAVYPEYFDRFTDPGKDWLFPVTSINNAFHVHMQTSTPPQDYCSTSGLKPWEKYICNTYKNPSDYQLNLPLFGSINSSLLQNFLAQFKTYITSSNNASNNFWNGGSIAGTSRNDLIDWVLGTATFNLENIQNAKRDSCIKKILDAPMNPNFQWVATIIDNDAELAVIKLLNSAKTEQAAKSALLVIENYTHPNDATINYKGLKFLNLTFDDGFGEDNDNFTGVFFTLANLINIANTGKYNNTRINNFLDAIDPQLPEAEQDLFQFDQFNAQLSAPTKVTIENQEYSYDDMITIKITGSFSMGGKSFQKGTLLTVPALEAYLFDHNNTCAVGEKAAWLSLDIASCCIGIGGAKIFFTAGNWLRKSIVLADLIGSTSGMVVQSLNNDAISPALRSKIQLASLALNVPQLLTCIPKISKVVDDIDLFIDANRFSLNSNDIDAINSLRLEKTKLIAAANLSRNQNFLSLIQNVKSKLGFMPSSPLNFTNFTSITTSDNFIDVIIHYKNGSFVISKEGGLTKDILLEDLAGIINSTASGKTVRLLSCNDLNAAEQLSQLTNKPFYASDGWVDVYVNGEIRSQSDFYKFENGTRSSPITHNSVDIPGINKIRLGATTAITKTNLVNKFINLETRYDGIIAWINSLDEVADAGLLTRLNQLEPEYFARFDVDLLHNTYGAEIKSLIKENPDDLTDIWKRLKDDPAYSWEIQKTGGSRWEKWGQREFFKDITAKGKGFETDVCLATFKNRTSQKYLELKQKFFNDTQVNGIGKNLDDYDMYSQVQLKYDGENYFIADQLFVKYKTVGGQKVVDDLVVIENKLSSTTPLTTPQSTAFTKTSFTVRSQSASSQFGTAQNLTSGTVINFSDTKQWYKVHDGTNGDAISGINKMQ